MTVRRGEDMKHRGRVILVSIVALVGLAVLAFGFSGSSALTLLGIVINTFTAHNQPGMLVLEVNESAATSSPGTTGTAPPPQASAPPPDSASWSSYIKTLTSERYSPLSEINKTNV